MLGTIFLSMFSLNLKSQSPPVWAGLRNYLILLKDPRALLSLYHTSFFTLVSVGLELVLGVALALILHKRFKGRGVLRAATLIPWAIPTVVAALLWKWIFNDQYGIINELLLRTGLISGYKSWLGETGTAMFSLIITDVWKTTPFMALLLLAGLQMIPRELYEAARVDGASALGQFYYITLPLLIPSILVALLFRSIDAFRIFDMVYVMTGGGPGNSTETLSLYTYKTLFSFLDFGYGAALSAFTFFCVASISAVYVMFLRRRHVY
jgi:multiple sugar transport system permease protein